MTKILLGIAVLPTFVIFAIVLKNARSAREPFKKIAKVFGISVASTILAMILEVIGELVVAEIFEAAGADPQSVLGVLIDCFFVIAAVEEGCKYFSFKLMIFHDRAFDNTYDGVIYGAASALGFATLENILYVVGGGLGIGLLRAVLSVPLHACTGIFMGYYFGISKYKKYNDISHDKDPQRRAYLIAVAIHALYDFFLMADGATDSPKDFIYIGMAAVLVITVIVYLIMIFTIKRARREDQPIYNRYYYEQLNGSYQDMIGTTSNKKLWRPQPVMQPYGAPPYGGQMQPPYGQPVPMNGMNRAMPPMPPYGAPNAPMYGMPPNSGMNSALAANRAMPGGNGLPGGGFGRPMHLYQGQDTLSAQPVHAQSGIQTKDPLTRGFVPQTIGESGVVSSDNAPTPLPVSFCSECGSRLEGEVAFCPLCGNRI